MFEYCATFILDVQCLIRSWRRMYSRNNLRKIAAFHGDETIQARSHWCFWIDLFEKGSYTRNFWASWWNLLLFLLEPIIQHQKCNWLDVLFYLSTVLATSSSPSEWKELLGSQKSPGTGTLKELLIILKRTFKDKYLNYFVKNSPRQISQSATWS